MSAGPTAQQTDRPATLPIPLPFTVIGHDDAATVAIQPRALDTETDYYKTTHEIVSHVRREWADGDSGPGGRCTRCFACTAKGNVCRLMVNRYVSLEEARDFSPRSLGVSVGPI